MIQEPAHIHTAIDLLRHTSRMHRRNIEKRVGEGGIHHGQRILLLFLSGFDQPLSQREIADHFDISPACVARSLKLLATDGYITRTGNESDSRRKNVVITEKGKQVVEETRRTCDSFDQEAFQDFSIEEIDQLIALLQRLKQNLTQIETQQNNTLPKSKGSVSD